MPARKPQEGAAAPGAGNDTEQPADGAGQPREAPGAPGAGEAAELAWFQAPGHVIGFTLPLDAVIQGQVDSGFLVPADSPE